MFWSGFIGMKFLAAVAVLFGLSWLVCTNLIGPDKLYYDQQRRATEDYLKRAIPKIVDTWDYKALEERTTPELHVSGSWKRMPEKFRIYKKELGKVTEYQNMLGSVELDASTGEDIVLGSYSQRAVFQHGVGDIAVVVIKRNGSWKLSRFSVRSAVIPADLDDDQ